MFISILLSIHVYAYLYVKSSIYVSIYLLVYPSIQASIQSIYLLIWLCIHLIVYPPFSFMYLSNHLLIHLFMLGFIPNTLGKPPGETPFHHLSNWWDPAASDDHFGKILCFTCIIYIYIYIAAALALFQAVARLVKCQESASIDAIWVKAAHTGLRKFPRAILLTRRCCRSTYALLGPAPSRQAKPAVPRTLHSACRRQRWEGRGQTAKEPRWRYSITLPIGYLCT